MPFSVYLAFLEMQSLTAHVFVEHMIIAAKI
jgi:hypothetical protein